MVEYPGFDDPVSAEQLERDGLLAKRVVEWVAELISLPA